MVWFSHNYKIIFSYRNEDASQIYLTDNTWPRRLVGNNAQTQVQTLATPEFLQASFLKCPLPQLLQLICQGYFFMFFHKMSKGVKENGRKDSI